MQRVWLLIPFVLCSSSLVACGNRGDLYLPDTASEHSPQVVIPQPVKNKPPAEKSSDQKH